MKKCIRCGEKFDYLPQNCKWDYNGTEPAKLTECPLCNCWQPIRYESAKNTNKDERYYIYLSNKS